MVLGFFFIFQMKLARNPLGVMPYSANLLQQDIDCGCVFFFSDKNKFFDQLKKTHLRGISRGTTIVLISNLSSCKSENYFYFGGETLVNTGPKSGLPKEAPFVKANFSKVVPLYTSHRVSEQIIRFMGVGLPYKHCTRMWFSTKAPYYIKYNSLQFYGHTLFHTIHLLRKSFICFMGRDQC